VADFVIEVLDHLDFGPGIKWVDDVAEFSFPNGGGTLVDGVTTPFTYPYEIEDIMAATECLGVPWHKEKLQPFGPLLTYLGFLWDIPSKSVSLPEPKRLRFKEKVDSFVGAYSNARAPRKEAMSLHGSLSHIAFVYPRGRSYLPNLSSFVSSFGHNKYAPRYPPHSLLSDLRWWSQTLTVADVSRSLVPRGPSVDPDVWVDASTSWGIGILVGDHWDAWQLIDGWKCEGRDIGWAEGVAIELAILVLELMGFRDCRILIRSDNVGVIGAYSRGRGRNFQVNASIRRAETVAMACNVSHNFIYVASEENRADPISRGLLGLPGLQNPFRIALPSELSPFLSHVSC
jgi:hypothetical protein